MVFYQPGITPHNLPRDPFKACVIPRPIGWISTISRTGCANLAPYSQFANLTFDPPYVMFAANQTAADERKDTVVNAEATGFFCWNVATWALRDAVNVSAEQVPAGVDEFARAGLRKVTGTLVPCPMVADAPVRFECEYHSTLRLPGNPPMGSVSVVIGRVVGVHIDDDVLTDGLLDVRKVLPIARCGYYEYAVVRETFEMVIPGDGSVAYGLEGSAAENRRRAGEGGAKEEEMEKKEKEDGVQVK